MDPIQFSNDLDIQSGYDFSESSQQLYDKKYKNIPYQTLTKTQIASSGMPDIELSTEDETNEGRERGDVIKVLCDVGMDEFMANVASKTGDGGCIFKDVLCDELSIFNAFVKNVFDNQHEDIAQLLDQEEISLRERYEQWTRMIQNRSNRVKNFLKEILPNCSWEDYKRKYSSQIRMQSRRTSDSGPEGDFNAWRQESFLKLLFLEDEAKKLQIENDEMLKAVEDLRCSKYMNHTRRAKAGKLLHQNNLRLEKKLKQLREERNRLSGVINDLFLKYEQSHQTVNH